MKTMIARAKERDAKFNGKKEKIDHDLVAYGVSCDRSEIKDNVRKDKRV